MPRDAHDGAGPVSHQNVVGDPDRDLLLVDRIDRVSADEYAGLFLRQVGPFQIGLGLDLLPIFRDVLLPVWSRQLVDQRMLGGEHHVVRTVKGVVPGRENPDAVAGIGDPGWICRARSAGITDPGYSELNLGA